MNLGTYSGHKHHTVYSFPFRIDSRFEIGKDKYDQLNLLWSLIKESMNDNLNFCAHVDNFLMNNIHEGTLIHMLFKGE